jgi:hypothetical protein
MKQLTLNRENRFLLGILLLLVTSCSSIKLISGYDEITDNTFTSFQEKVIKTLVKLESEVGTDQANYQNYKQFYQEAKVDLHTLQIRADAIDKNEKVQGQIEELTNMLDKMEKLHKIGFSTVVQIKPIKNSFYLAFTAIIKLQMGLKR